MTKISIEMKYGQHKPKFKIGQSVHFSDFFDLKENKNILGNILSIKANGITFDYEVELDSGSVLLFKEHELELNRRDATSFRADNAFIYKLKKDIIDCEKKLLHFNLETKFYKDKLKRTKQRLKEIKEESKIKWIT